MKTIKQRISYAVMGLMTMGFTACTQNEDMAPTLKGQEINATFSVGGMQTRVNTLGYGDSWEDNDELKVRIITDYDPGSTAVLSFYRCQSLKEVILGKLTDVRGEANSEDGIFDGILTRRTVLYLPESQEVMKGEFDENRNQYIWKPTGEKYFDSTDYDNGIFLGYQFSLVESWR